jgi:arylsulfatase
MTKRLWLLGLLLPILGCGGPAPRADASGAAGPNVIFILADDLGYGELGCYDQKKILTPRIDRMATEGLRFTDAYAGNTVCAPSRCCLMTGMHPGHAWVRDNRTVGVEGQTPLPASTVTVAKLLQKAGYATGATGKWGLGGPGTEGDPNRQGFDSFFGFNCQGHAHNHYPIYLWRDDHRVALPGNDGTYKGKTYSHDLFEKEALDFIRAHRERPFFLYVPFTIPHVSIQVPEDSLAPYKDWEETPYWGERGYLPHPRPRAGHAGMITRMDRSVGRILDLVSELGLDERTIVIFTSDNGSIDKAGGHDLAFFEANGPLRGQKELLFEGGIRVPFIARWPGKIRPGTTNAAPLAFWDVLPTLCDLAHVSKPEGIDGVSFAATLQGGPAPAREFLYWEFPSAGGQQAVRMGRWKALRGGLNKGPSPIQLYDLAADLGESTDVASQHPDVVARAATIMSENHRRSELFPIPGLDEPAK